MNENDYQKILHPRLSTIQAEKLRSDQVADKVPRRKRADKEKNWQELTQREETRQQSYMLE